MKEGIETHTWGLYRIGDGVLIATCVATTWYESQAYFEDSELDVSPMYEILIIRSKK